MNKRRAHSEFQQHRDRVGRSVRRQRAVDLFNTLTEPLLLELAEAYLPAHRERLYPPTVTLSMFIKQCWRQTARAKGRSTAGRHNAQRKGCPRTVWARKPTAERAGAYQLR